MHQRMAPRPRSVGRSARKPCDAPFVRFSPAAAGERCTRNNLTEAYQVRRWMLTSLGKPPGGVGRNAQPSVLEGPKGSRALGYEHFCRIVMRNGSVRNLACYIWHIRSSLRLPLRLRFSSSLERLVSESRGTDRGRIQGGLLSSCVRSATAPLPAGRGTV